jgi:hypothetical protein
LKPAVKKLPEAAAENQPNHLRTSVTGTQRNRRHVIAASYAFQGYNFRKSYPHASLQDFNAGFG